MRYFLVNIENFDFQVVVVENEKDWESTQSYLKDCGIDMAITEVQLLSPGDLADLVAPRDE